MGGSCEGCRVSGGDTARDPRRASHGPSRAAPRPWMVFTSSHAADAGLSAGFPVWGRIGDFIELVWSRPGLLLVFHVKRPLNL